MSKGWILTQSITHRRELANYLAGVRESWKREYRRLRAGGELNAPDLHLAFRWECSVKRAMLYCLNDACRYEAQRMELLRSVI